MRRSVMLLVLILLGAVSQVVWSAPPSPRGERRLLYVSDPSSIATNLFPDPVQSDDLRRWVDMLADSGVDTFNQEIYNQCWTTYWRSERFEYDPRPQHKRFLPLLEQGTQPLNVLIEQTRKRGMTFIAGFRMNDNHGGVGKFVSAHPEWVLREFPEGELYARPKQTQRHFDKGSTSRVRSNRD